MKEQASKITPEKAKELAAYRILAGVLIRRAEERRKNQKAG